MQKVPIQIKTKDGQTFDIPEYGSLGLLALGYIGLMLWRKKREKVRNEKQEPIVQDEKA